MKMRKVAVIALFSSFVPALVAAASPSQQPGQVSRGLTFLSDRDLRC